MTGSAFANLMPLIHAKEAAMARDTTEGNGLETGDEPPASGGLDWGMGVYNPWEYVKRYLGRLNIGMSDMAYMSLCGLNLPLMPCNGMSDMAYMSLCGLNLPLMPCNGKSDMAYISLYSPDPPLIRPNVFYLSGLPPGTRVFDVIRRCQAADLGRVRVTMLSPTTAYIEVLTFEECAKQKARDAREASVPKGVQTGSKGGDTVLGARPSKRMRPEGGGGDPNGEAPNNCYKCNVM
eukprot:gene7192-300_t